MKKNVTILVISISTPILVGIYEKNILIQTIKNNGKTSDILPQIFHALLNSYDIEKILYVNGPGSFMAIKVAYIFLKTLSITKNILLVSCDGFEFNNTTPIKALAKKYFFKDKNGKIYIDSLDDNDILNPFELPKTIENIIYSKECLPNYNLPAVN
jgi:tRNA A37 threonylcarbamoyladenosine modification protein TsaB